MPTVALNTGVIARNAPKFTIGGTGFSTTAANNTVTLDLSAVGVVIAATATILTVAFTSPPNINGVLKAVVTVSGTSSGAAVQVAVVASPPVVTKNTGLIPANSTGVNIAGSGFAAGKSATVTITNASPAVVTWTAHGFAAN